MAGRNKCFIFAEYVQRLLLGKRDKMDINILPAYDRHEEIGMLFSEYTDMLAKGDPAIWQYLQIQNYEKEIKNLGLKYGPPEGRLYLACQEDSPAGCIGLRKIDSENCEMKRLYVRPAYRGRQIGSRLVRRIVEDAKEIGYRHMLLDTLPFLNDAVRMYKHLGFYEISRYNNSPMKGSIYMKLDLQ